MLFSRNANEILGSSIQFLQQNTELTRFSPGSKAQALVLAMNQQIAMAYSLFDLNVVQSFIFGATGIYLDYIGELLGVVRRPASTAQAFSAERNVKVYTFSPSFGAINNNQPILIPKGTLIYSGGVIEGQTSIYFRTTEDEILSPSVSEAYLSVESATEGRLGNIGINALTSIDFQGYADSQNKSLLITNTAPISRGSDVEDDDTFRFRILNEKIRSEAANETAIRLAALTVPGVSDVVLQRYSRGLGTGEVIVQGTSAVTDQSTIALVQQQVNQVSSFGSLIIARGAEPIGIQTNLTIKYKPNVSEAEKSQVELQLYLNYKNYLLNLPLGSPLIYNSLISLFQDPRIQSIGEPNRPLDDIFYFKNEGSFRIRRRLIKDLVINFDEKLIPEYSVESSLVIRRA